MSEYYDREKFTGERKSQQSPKKPDDSGWYSWPAIIVLFAIGLWPVALYLMLKKVFGSLEKTGHASTAAKQGEAKRPTAVQETMEKRRGATAGAPYTTVNERVAEAEKIARETIERVKAQTAQSSKTPTGKSKKKSKEKLPGKALRIIGICLLVIGAIVTVDFAATTLQGWSTYLEDLFTGLGFMVAGGMVWGRGRYLAHMTRRSQRYILAIGNVDVMSLAEIAKRVNRTPEKAARELQKLIDKGYLGEDAYIDHQPHRP